MNDDDRFFELKFLEKLERDFLFFFSLQKLIEEKRFRGLVKFYRSIMSFFFSSDEWPVRCAG